MTTTTTRDEVTVTSRTVGAAIVPGDFSSKQGEHRWTQGTLRHVSDALAGRPVLIVTDTMTGHTLIATLGRPNSTPGTRYGFELTYLGEDRPTVHRVEKLGAIIPLESAITDDPKWKALDLHRAEQRAAITVARRRVTDPEAGRWEATSHADHVAVTRTAEGHRATGFEHFPVTLGAVAEERAAEFAPCIADGAHVPTRAHARSICPVASR